MVDEMAVANAHPAGAKPFTRPDYIRKFDTLTEGLVQPTERDRFLNLVQSLATLRTEDVAQLNVQLELSKLESAKRDQQGIF
jgi:2-methylcitrate dehydratase